MNRWRRLRAWLTEPGSGLSRRVTHGGIWAFAINVLNRLLQLARTVVLARLLAPEDFGLFGITMLALSALQRLTQPGFEAALIQKREDTSGDLDTAWLVQIFRGIGLGGVLFFAAPHVAAFFQEPGATPLIRVLAAVSVLSGLRNIGVVYFRKEIEFHREFLFKLSKTVPDLIVSVIAALILRNAWALVWGLVAGRLIQTIASYGLHRYRPSLRFDLSRAKNLFNFGKYITAQSVVLFLLTEGDDALVGRVLGATSLGFYQIAYQLSNIAATQITHIISSVTFPAYSKLQDSPGKLKRGLLRTLGLTAFLALPVAGTIGILAPDITHVFLGEKWMPMVPAMQVLSFFGAMRAIAATYGPVYRALARVDVPLEINTTQLFILAIIIYPCTVQWGIIGTSFAVTGAMVVALIHTSVQICLVTGLTLKRLYRPAIPSTVATLALILQLHYLQQWQLSVAPVVELSLWVLLAALSYLLLTIAGFKVLGYRVEQFRKILTSMVGR